MLYAANDFQRNRSLRMDTNRIDIHKERPHRTDLATSPYLRFGYK